MTLPVWGWAATFAAFAVLMVADLTLTRNTVGLRAAAVSSALWIAAAVAFGCALWLWQGPATAGQYYAGYLLEKALSVDNVFVFVMLFASLQVPAALQRRVLQFGVIGALVLRGVFIAAGGALIEHISWIFYAFGALVLLAGVRMFRAGAGQGQGRNLAVRGLRRVLPVTDDYVGHRFFVRGNGKLVATPLFVALVAIEATDLVFALDSIPAVFGVTSDMFVVFTSNAFAVLGLRALYFLLAGSVDRFVYLKQGIAILLVFIGVKMLLSPVIHLPIWVSLAVIMVVAGGAVGASLWRERTRSRPAAAPGHAPGPGQESQAGQAPGAGRASGPGQAPGVGQAPGAGRVARVPEPQGPVRG
jgi:tellurite resistance protein TerC